MSVYANATIERRFSGFSIPRPSLSQETKAVLAAAAVWAVLLGIIAAQEPKINDLHSNTNIEDIRMNLPEADQKVDQYVPVRQHY